MKTHEQYVRQLEEKHNGRITCIGVYRGGTVEIEHFCNICKRKWLAKPENLVRTRASGCRLCAEDKVKRSKRTPEQYEKELRDIHQGRIIALDPYETRKKKLTHTCTVCSHVWSTLPAYILNGAGCPACNNKVKAKNLRQFTPTKTHSEYLRDLASVHFDTNYSIRGIHETGHTNPPSVRGMRSYMETPSRQAITRSRMSAV